MSTYIGYLGDAAKIGVSGAFTGISYLGYGLQVGAEYAAEKVPVVTAYLGDKFSEHVAPRAYQALSFAGSNIVYAVKNCPPQAPLIAGGVVGVALTTIFCVRQARKITSLKSRVITGAIVLEGVSHLTLGRGALSEIVKVAPTLLTTQNLGYLALVGGLGYCANKAFTSASPKQRFLGLAGLVVTTYFLAK